MYSQAREHYFNNFKPDEGHVVIEALSHLNHNVLPSQWQQIQVESAYAIERIINEKKLTAIESLFKEFDINSQEGALLISLAETLIQIPDYYTALKFIEDKMSQGQWNQFIGRSKPLIVNLSALAMKISARYMNDETPQTIWGQMNKRFGARCIYLMIRNIVKKTLNGYRFGSSINDVHLKRYMVKSGDGSFCIDICNNEAKNFEQAEENYTLLLEAIDEVISKPYILQQDSITLSFNLDALHPCCESLRSETLINNILPKFKTLLQKVKNSSLKLILNPVMSYQQDLLFLIIERLVQEQHGYSIQNFGVTLQAYSIRVLTQIEALKELMNNYEQTMTLKLIKGEFWDFEIKRARELGLDHYPVFTRKESTDLMYLTCCHRLFNNASGMFNLIFGTHNAHTIKSIEAFSNKTPYTIEKVKGSSNRVFKNVEFPEHATIQCFAPVGSQKEIAQYIKRKLSDKASKASFVNQLNGEEKTINKLSLSPIDKINKISTIKNPKLSLPTFNEEGEQFRAVGYDLNYRNELLEIIEQMNRFRPRKYLVCSMIWGQSDYSGDKVKHYNADETSKEQEQELAEVIGLSDAYHVDDTVQGARKAIEKWRHVSASKRTEMVQSTAYYLEQNRFQFIDLCIREIGMNFRAAVKEVQRGIDYCYALAIEQKNITQQINNKEKTQNAAQGVVACVSDETLGFSGIIKQVIAPLLAGNTIVVKPNARNVVSTFNFIQLLYKAGIDFEVIQFIVSFDSEFEKQLILNKEIDLVSYNGQFEKLLEKKQLLIKDRQNPDKIISENKTKVISIIDTTVTMDVAIDNIINNQHFNKNAQITLDRVYVQETMASLFLKRLTQRLSTLSKMDQTFFDRLGYFKPPEIDVKTATKNRSVTLLGCNIVFVKAKEIGSIRKKMQGLENNTSILLQTHNTTLQKHLIKTMEAQAFILNKPIESFFEFNALTEKNIGDVPSHRNYLMKFSHQKIIT